MKPFISFLISFFVTTNLFAQPTISNFSPQSGAIGSTVTIIGTNFNNTGAQNIVFFGATKGLVTRVTNTSLTVTVPPGATYQYISVTNLTTGLTAYSAKPFTTTLSGSTNFAAKINVITDFSPFSIAIADIDGDGKPDIVASNSVSRTVTVLRNTSTLGAVSFAPRADFSTNSPNSITIGDIDGDGKPDLVMTNNSRNTVSILRNTSIAGYISFENYVDFATDLVPNSVSIGDIDGDGRLDLAVTNYLSNTVSILRNTSAVSSISFAVKISFTTGKNPVSLSIGDLDGDGKPDLAVVNQNSNSVSIWRNNSSPGLIEFVSRSDFATSITPRSVVITDLDGDGKSDLAIANFQSGTISILRNLSIQGSITFATKTDLTANISCSSICVSDIDGDGKPDLTMTNSESSIVNVLCNTSISGAVSFAAKKELKIGSSSYSVKIGDIDGDGLPDLIVANQNTVSFLKQLNIAPIISNSSIAGQTQLVNGIFVPITVTATGTGLSYQWFSNTTNSNSGGTTLNAANGAQTRSYTPQAGIIGTLYYYCVVTGAGGASQKTAVSGVFLVTPVPPTISSVSMAGQTQLVNGIFVPITVTATGTGLSYQWFSNITNSNSGGTTLNAASGAQTSSYTPQASIIGTLYYYCVVTGAGGTTQKTVVSGAFVVKPVPPTISSVSMSGQTQLVNGIFVPITVTATGTGLSYQWFSNITNSNSGGTTLNAANGAQTRSYTPQAGTIGTLYYYCVVTATGGTPLKTVISGAFVVKPAIIVPVISRFSPESGAIGSSVTITGSNFNATGGKNIVFFGAARATVTSATFSSLTVTVPLGATYQYLSVTNLSTGLTAYSAKPFSVTLAGNISFAANLNFVTGSAPQLVSMGDVDGDGKPDLVVVNIRANTINVFRNTSNLNYISFANKVDFIGGISYATSVSIGDIDGDGMPDLVVANPETVSVLRNISTLGIISFSPKADFETGKIPYSVCIGDIDGDGKPDLAVVNFGDSTVSVLRNTSTPGTLSFLPKVNFSTGNNPREISIGDIDGDGKLDLVLVNQSSSTVSVLRNISPAGGINFAAKADFETGKTPYSVCIGDIDGDGKPDLAIANYGDSRTVSVLRNTSITGTVSFAAKKDFSAGVNPSSIRITDIDGDGKVDIAVTDRFLNKVSVLRNISTAGAVNFAAKVDFATGINPASVSIGDLNGDGKPDLVVANEGSNTISILKQMVPSAVPTRKISLGIITKQASIAGQSGFIINPNPVVSSRISIQFKNQPSGRYRLGLINNLGQLVFTVILQHTGANNTQIINLPAIIASGIYRAEILGIYGSVGTQRIIINKKN